MGSGIPSTTGSKLNTGFIIFSRHLCRPITPLNNEKTAFIYVSADVLSTWTMNDLDLDLWPEPWPHMTTNKLADSAILQQNSAILQHNSPIQLVFFVNSASLVDKSAS